MIPIGRAVASRRFKRVVGVTCAQAGKTDTIFDIIGQRLDQQPGPMLYVGPTSQFLKEQFEPRLMTMIDESTLADKLQRGKRMTKTRKVINGNPLRLAHGGSSTALKSDPAVVGIVDEVDELMANVKGQGSPVELVEARGDTVADFCMLAVSTCSAGPSETEVDPVSGLELWKRVDPKLIQSTIWKLWQQGSMKHWAVPCPECSRYFVPRFACVEWPEKVATTENGVSSTRKLTPKEVEREAFLRCPHRQCQAKIYDRPNEDNLKAEMNRRGVYVAAGQSITEDGEVVGEIPETDTESFWVSGLMSPFKTIGERAARYVEAARSGEQGAIQTVINSQFGELFFPRGGDAPEWSEVARLRLPYRFRDVPRQALILTAGVDVQKNRLVYVIRGWGRRQESWLIEHGELFGEGRPDETIYDDIWHDLADLLETEFDGLTIRRCFIDSGFRPGKPIEVPEHKVYAFCRTYSRRCMASKGYHTRQTPLSISRLEVQPGGGRAAYGLELARIDADWAKSWVHERIRWPDDAPGAWHIPLDASDDYCRQVVSEARARKITGGHIWLPSSKNNHYLDAEALAYAAAYLVGVQRIPENTPDRAPEEGAGGRRPSPAAGPQPISHDPHVFTPVPQVERRRSMADLNRPARPTI
jgi:phage terminase large subunit GpA-like protein